LGVEQDAVVYLLMGGLKPYKGLVDVIEAFDALPREGRRRRLLVAGQPDRSQVARDFQSRAAANPRIILHSRTVPACDMQLFLRAADVAVLPYQRALNSGVLLLALTFGLSVVVPSTAAIASVVTPGMSVTYDPNAPDGLRKALLAADELLVPSARKASYRIAAERRPEMVSAQFARELFVRLGT